MDNFQKKYLTEVSHRLQREGFIVQPEYSGLLPIKKDAHQLCTINLHGGLSYDPDFVRRTGLEDALDQVRHIAMETLAYMRQMETTPPLVATDLSGGYRLLAEFNNIVLAGHERQGGYGVEFITWERTRDGTGLWQGHYMENDYAAAKQEFAARSGLVDRDRMLSDEQLVEVYRCVQNALEGDSIFSREQESILQGIAEQIQQSVPDLEDQIAWMEAQGLNIGMTQSL